MLFNYIRSKLNYRDSVFYTCWSGACWRTPFLQLLLPVLFELFLRLCKQVPVQCPRSLYESEIDQESDPDQPVQNSFYISTWHPRTGRTRLQLQLYCENSCFSTLLRAASIYITEAWLMEEVSFQKLQNTLRDVWPQWTQLLGSRYK